MIDDYTTSFDKSVFVERATREVGFGAMGFVPMEERAGVLDS